jgi:hypothetical protein
MAGAGAWHEAAGARHVMAHHDDDPQMNHPFSHAHLARDLPLPATTGSTTLEFKEPR